MRPEIPYVVHLLSVISDSNFPANYLITTRFIGITQMSRIAWASLPSRTKIKPRLDKLIMQRPRISAMILQEGTFSDAAVLICLVLALF